LPRVSYAAAVTQEVAVAQLARHNETLALRLIASERICEVAGAVATATGFKASCVEFET
jgi:hypothetical protein